MGFVCFQSMEDRAHVAMNSPYDFVNYISLGTLDLGNGAINPEESLSKEHWLSSIGLASILAGGAKPIVRGPKTPSLQDRNLVLEKTVDKAHELTTKTKSHVNYVIGEVRGGIHVLFHEMNDNNNLAYSLNAEGLKIPFNVLDTEAVKKVLDRVLSKFSLSGSGKGAMVKDRQIDYTRGFEVDPKYSSYEQRVKTTPVNKGEWNSERAESLFISDKTGEVKKYLDEAGVDGVEYKNGMPDFSPFSKGEIKLENMTNDRKSNFSTADEELAKKWSTPDQKWTAEDVADWREDNKYTWHELNDLETIQLVPSKINSVFKHLGGVGEYNIKVKLGE